MNATEIEPVRVERFNARLIQPQIWHDSWRNTDRIIRFKGRCFVCRKRTFGADDGENDPRGVLGDYAASPLHAEEHGMLGVDVPLCFLCGDNYERYKMALEYATRTVWKHPEQEAEEYDPDNHYSDPDPPEYHNYSRS